MCVCVCVLCGALLAITQIINLMSARLVCRCFQASLQSMWVLCCFQWSLHSISIIQTLERKYWFCVLSYYRCTLGRDVAHVFRHFYKINTTRNEHNWIHWIPLPKTNRPNAKLSLARSPAQTECYSLTQTTQHKHHFHFFASHRSKIAFNQTYTRHENIPFRKMARWTRKSTQSEERRQPNQTNSLGFSYDL